MSELLAALLAASATLNVGLVAALFAERARSDSDRAVLEGRTDKLLERIQRPHLIPTSTETTEDPEVLVLHADDDEGYAKLRGLN